MRKWLDGFPTVKFALALACIALWSVGLADQLADLTQTAKYVGISLLLVAVAAI